VKLAQELFRIWADNVYEIGTIGLTPTVQGVVVVNNRFRNVPATLGNDWPLRSPGNARSEQFYFPRGEVLADVRQTVRRWSWLGDDTAL
jgi:peptide/nickel transport system substrate-binding protein